MSSTVLRHQTFCLLSWCQVFRLLWLDWLSVHEPLSSAYIHRLFSRFDKKGDASRSYKGIADGQTVRSKFWPRDDYSTLLRDNSSHHRMFHTGTEGSWQSLVNSFWNGVIGGVHLASNLCIQQALHKYLMNVSIIVSTKFVRDFSQSNLNVLFQNARIQHLSD